MYLTAVWTFIYICFSKCFLLDAYTQLYGRIKVIHRSPKMVRCVSNLLYKSELRGFRVSEADDKCEGLIGPLDDEDDFEQGYMYAKLISRKESFKPSTELPHHTEYIWDFPGTFTMGTRINVYVTWPEKEWNKITFTVLEDTYLDNKNLIHFSAFGDAKYFNLWEQSATLIKDVEYDTDINGTACEISFVAGANNDMKVLLDGKTLFTWQGERIIFDLLTEVRIHYSDLRDAGSFFIQAIEINEEKKKVDAEDIK